ncbi:MAG: Hpt domain-containing protein [Thiotrichales bacterium]
MNDFTSSATQALLHRYIDSLGEKADSIEASRTTLLDHPDDRAQWQSLKLSIHRLSGSAGAYGFDAIGELAKQADILIRALLERDAIVDPAEFERIDGLVVRLVGELRNPAA